MKLQSKFMEAPKLVLLAGLGLLATANVYAEEGEKAGVQVSMINQTGERIKVDQELKALEEEYVNAIVEALNRKSNGPDYYSEDIYVSHLVDVIEGKTQQDQPDFSDDDVYVDYLVKILMN